MIPSKDSDNDVLFYLMFIVFLPPFLCRSESDQGGPPSFRGGRGGRGGFGRRDDHPYGKHDFGILDAVCYSS